MGFDLRTQRLAMRLGVFPLGDTRPEHDLSFLCPCGSCVETRGEFEAGRLRFDREGMLERVPVARPKLPWESEQAA